MILVDSSIIIAAFREEETLHQEALEILRDAGKILLLDSVISEIATVLKIRESHGISVQCLDFLMNNRDITIHHSSPEDFEKTLSFFQREKNKLSFVDTALLLLGKKKGIPLATFDKDLGKAFTEKQGL